MARGARVLLLTVLGSILFARSGPSEPGIDRELVTGPRELIVVSLNTWHAGRGVADGAQKIERLVVEEGADLVALQESEGVLAAELAARLGWWSAQSPGSAAVLSRHPIVEELRLAGEMESKAIGARVRVSGSALPLTIWSVHLQYDPYGPYDAELDGLPDEQVVEREHRSGRVREIVAVLAAASADLDEALAGRSAVIVAGDWNAPSHLDWTPAAASLHGGRVIAWPTSLAAERAGLRDAFREAKPDPTAAPGATWSPIHAIHEGTADVAEPQDRIDFVHVAGPLDTLRAESVVRGSPRPYPDPWTNDWPSDHAAVVARFVMP